MTPEQIGELYEAKIVQALFPFIGKPDNEENRKLITSIVDPILKELDATIDEYKNGLQKTGDERD